MYARKGKRSLFMILYKAALYRDSTINGASDLALST
jgi:hypothetical protein